MQGRRNIFEYTVDKPSLSQTWCGQNSKIENFHDFTFKNRTFVPKYGVDKSTCPHMFRRPCNVCTLALPPLMDLVQRSKGEPKCMFFTLKEYKAPLIMTFCNTTAENEAQTDEWTTDR